MAHYISKDTGEVITDFMFMRLDSESQKRYSSMEPTHPKLRANPNIKTGLLYCKQCGGTNVEIEAWVDANTHEYIDNSSSEEGYCSDCGERVELIEK